MQKKVVERFTFIFSLSILLIINSCIYQPDIYKNSERTRRLGQLYTEEAKYLAIDSIHNTPAKREKYKELREQFLKVWLDSSNCYKIDIWKSNEIKEISFANILYSPNYDTLLFLVSWYSEGPNSKTNITQARGLNAIIDSAGKLQFQCKKMLPGLYSINEGNRMQEFNFHLKRYVAKARFLKEDKTPDPTFWYRSYNDQNIYSKDWELPEGK
jgi:hypothetical protein